MAATKELEAVQAAEFTFLVRKALHSTVQERRTYILEVVCHRRRFVDSLRTSNSELILASKRMAELQDPSALEALGAAWLGVCMGWQAIIENYEPNLAENLGLMAVEVNVKSLTQRVAFRMRTELSTDPFDYPACLSYTSDLIAMLSCWQGSMMPIYEISGVWRPEVRKLMYFMMNNSKIPWPLVRYNLANPEEWRLAETKDE